MTNQESELKVGTPIQPPELTVVDLQNLKALIDTATRRGAFIAAEMSAVGAVYDRLNVFLMSVAPPPQEKTEPEKAE